MPDAQCRMLNQCAKPNAQCPNWINAQLSTTLVAYARSTDHCALGIALEHWAFGIAHRLSFAHCALSIGPLGNQAPAALRVVFRGREADAAARRRPPTGARRGVGTALRRASSSSIACSNVTDSGFMLFGTDALVVPSVT